MRISYEDKLGIKPSGLGIFFNIKKIMLRVYLEWYLPAMIAPLYGQNEHYGVEFC